MKVSYLDYMSTTPVDPAVKEAMLPFLGCDQGFGNSGSNTHIYGFSATEVIIQARAQVASIINASPAEIIWTSGATESNNLAIQGAARFYARKGRHLVTVKTEHKAVLDVFESLSYDGYEVTYLDVNHAGEIELEDLKKAIRPDTILVSTMHVNNETGVIHDIEAIAGIVKATGALLHVDAAQSIGKVPLDVSSIPVDLLSISAHKIYGPKGVGALFVRQSPRVRLQPIMLGGGQEKGLRAGTLPTHQVVGLGAALALAEQRFDQDATHINFLAEQLHENISSISQCSVVGAAASRFAGCVNLCIDGVKAETLLNSMPHFALSLGSACNSAQAVPSHVLTAMGLSRKHAEMCFRVSFGRFTGLSEVKQFASELRDNVLCLRSA